MEKQVLNYGRQSDDFLLRANKGLVTLKELMPKKQALVHVDIHSVRESNPFSGEMEENTTVVLNFRTANRKKIIKELEQRLSKEENPNG